MNSKDLEKMLNDYMASCENINKCLTNQQYHARQDMFATLARIFDKWIRDQYRLQASNP